MLNSMRHLGIDVGTKRIGLALSDEAGSMGFPHKVIQNSSNLVNEILELIKKEKVRVVVIGDSRDFSGNENPIAQKARTLGESLGKNANIPIFYESETLTTAEARRAPEKEMKTRSPKSKKQVDDSAAALILTSYLTRTKND